MVSIPGTRKVRTRSFSTVTDAVRWKRQAEAGIRQAVEADAPLLVRDLANQYMAALRSGRARTRGGKLPAAETIRDIEGCLNGHLIPVIGDLPVRDVGRGDLHRIVDNLSAGGMSASRVRSVTGAAGSMWRWAIDRDLAENTPTANLSLPSEGPGRALPPHTPAQVAELLRYVRDEDRAAWALWGWCGLRKLEVHGLTWGDIDLRARTVTVRRGKTDNAARVVPLPAPAVQAIRAHRIVGLNRPDLPVMRPLYRANPGTGWGVDKAIKRGQRAWDDENDWRELDGRPALVPLTPHPMRHLVGTWLMQAGVQRVVRSAWLGHSRKGLGVTDGVYTHVQQTDLDRAREALDALLTGQLPGLVVHRAAH